MQRIKAVDYIECSALTSKGVASLFDSVVEVGADKTTKQNKVKCVIVWIKALVAVSLHIGAWEQNNSKIVLIS